MEILPKQMKALMSWGATTQNHFEMHWEAKCIIKFTFVLANILCSHWALTFCAGFLILILKLRALFPELFLNQVVPHSVTLANDIAIDPGTEGLAHSYLTYSACFWLYTYPLWMFCSMYAVLALGKSSCYLLFFLSNFLSFFLFMKQSFVFFDQSL